MKNNKYIWMIGLAVTLAVIVIPIVYFLPKDAKAAKDPWATIPEVRPHTDHAPLMEGPYNTPQEVTRACLECHEDASTEVMQTTHWTWESEPFDVSWRDEPVTIGKINQINNFCLSAQGNEIRCATCHIGYNWEEENNLANAENIDCLACHADNGVYVKGEYGNPAEGVDLVAAAKSIRLPTRENCGACHFNGGGGNGVKHGDLDESLYFPTESLDVHMGRFDMVCIDCHTTTEHQVKGRLVVDNVVIDPEEQVACTDCHETEPHTDERINSHLVSVACQTCHVPSIAVEDPTKTFWDWSTSGQDIPEDHFTYLKIKGNFEYQTDVKPNYSWFNGNLAYRYILGDPVNTEGVTYINLPDGNINDPSAKIFPFKVHVAIQPYDTGYNYLLAPITAGKDGYWTNFDWDQAFELADEQIGLDYSGSYGFTETWMYWPSTHMVQPKENALQCTNCHGENSRLDWQSLGYPGDPVDWGTRFDNNPELKGQLP